MTQNAGLNVDEAAVVIDKHTGRVRAQFQGLGAERDAAAHLRHCQSPGPGGAKVDHLSSACVVTGDKARKAIKNGRI